MGAHPTRRFISSCHRKHSIRIGQLQFPQIVAGVWQTLQKGWQALEAQPRQVVTARDQRPSLVPATNEVQGISVWGTVCETCRSLYDVTTPTTRMTGLHLCTHGRMWACELHHCNRLMA